MSRWARLVEDSIQQAMKEGAFDHLEGKGKPLRMVESPFADPGTRAAYGLLRDSGHTLPWIADRKEIDAHLAKFELD